jgi:hypothetical protein
VTAGLRTEYGQEHQPWRLLPRTLMSFGTLIRIKAPVSLG